MGEQVILDVVIIGAGPAGLSAAVYAGRARLNAVLLEKGMEGGQLLNTEEIDNYLGLVEITGPQLSVNMYEHVKKFGIEPIIAEVLEIKEQGKLKVVVTTEGEYLTKTVVLGMGIVPRRLGVPNEEKLWGRGVSYCAICDGGFFRDKVVAVVGGGDKAVEDALYLARMAAKVYLIHRRDQLRANKVLQENLFRSNIEVLWDTTIEQLYEREILEGVQIRNMQTGKLKNLQLDGLFVGVGSDPSTGLVKDFIELDESGYVIAGENCHTSRAGVYAIGDIRQKPLRQILTAAADGAVSIYEAEQYILENF